MIAGAYLSGTNTRRVRRALNAVLAGPVGKDVVSRVWRKTKGDWDAWNARSLAEEPIVRLILDGTVARVRLDRRATSISFARGARRARRRPEDAARDQEHGRERRGGLACAARRSRPARIANAGAGRHRRRAGPRKGGGGAWPDMAVQRCAVHKHRNLRAHAPERLHEEISNDYRDMIYAATRGEVGARRKAFIRKWRLKCRAVADSLEEAGDRLFTFTRFPPSQWKSIRTSNARSSDCTRSSSAGSRPRPRCPAPQPPPCWALLASGQIAVRRVDGWQTLAEKPDDQIIDLAA